MSLAAAGAIALGLAALAITRALAGPLAGLFFSIPLAVVFVSGLLGSVWTALLTTATFVIGALPTGELRAALLHVGPSDEAYRFAGFVALALATSWVSGRTASAYRRAREARAAAEDAACDARRARDELELVLGIVSHDLRTPLSAVRLGCSALLRRGDLAPEHRVTVQRMDASARRMARLVADVVDLGRILRGEGITAASTPVDTAAVCRQAAAEFDATSSRARRIEVTAAAAPVVIGDGDRLVQVVSNLLGNALQHGTRDRPVQVSVHEERGAVVIAVHNDGRPIPPETLSRIFAPFQRGAGASAGELRGSVGLGLYIADRIVAAHGGGIEVTSTSTAGTTFTVRLPADGGTHPAGNG